MTSTPFFDILLEVDEQDKSKFALKITPPLFTSHFSDNLAKSVCQSKFQKLREEAKLTPGGQFDVNTAYDRYTECLVSSLKGSQYIIQ